MFPWLFVALVIVPADPINGTTITARERDILPSGEHLGSIADTWLLETTSMQPGHNGIALFDPLYVSSHGRSWTQQRFLLNGLEITDPAQPGQPLIEVPHHFWERLHYRSLWTSTPGFEWEVEPASAQQRVDASGVWGTDVGGGTWVPAGAMDREPALRTGASPVRRALGDAPSGHLDVRFPVAGTPAGARLAFDQVDHTHTYPTLLTSTGQQIADRARRTTVLGGARLRIFDLPLDLLTVYQSLGRSHDGAQARFPEALTHARHSDAVIAQGATELRLQRGWRIALEAGFGWRAETWQPNHRAPVVWDLEEQWTWLQRPRFGERLERRRFDVAAVASLGQTRLSLTGYHADLTSVADIPGQRVATTFLSSANPQERSVWLTHYETHRAAQEWLQGGRLALDAEPRLLGIDWRLHASLDYGAVGTPAAVTAVFVSPALGITATKRLADSEIFLLLRREPELLTAELAAFLDPRRPRGTRHRWSDDGDLIPEAGESGALLSRVGGDSHAVEGGLRRPTSNHFAVGWRSPRFGPFRVTLAGIGRFLIDRFTVRLSGPSYRAVVIDDPGGDGLGERSGRLIVYAREPGGEGEERYLLNNASTPDFFLGAELALSTVADTWWFVSLGLAGYWDIGTAPFGLYADQNDPGIIDPASADPNAQVNARGRYDHDRAFAAHLLLGLAPRGVLEGLRAGLVIRYRDGEPMSRILVVEGLPQGPTAVMAVARGDPVPRFTFQLTVDLELRYAWRVGGVTIGASLEVSNLLGSGTELIEDVITGEDYRRSLEMIPGRTVLVGLDLGWR